MLPAIFVTFATFLLELSTTSPVYNMQPAFITANIGTTGRNIRNLPCISRKTNQSGVCMFAIDCLKANGTHLGTCIDRFYFGSCCHIEPVNDIMDNTIDDIIPAREPPLRLSSTIRPISTISTNKNKTTSTTVITTTTATRITTSTTTSTPTPTTITKQSTTRTTTTTSTEKPKPLKQEETTTVGYKLTTFQSVDGNLAAQTTAKNVTTEKPPATSVKTTLKPKPTKATQKPTKSTLKPIRTTVSTKKPTSKPAPNTTRRPVLTTTTRKVNTTVTTRKPSTTVRKPSTTITTTRRPTTAQRLNTTTTQKTKKPSTAVPLKSTTATTKKPIVTPKPTKITTRPIKITTASTTTTTTTTTQSPTTITTTRNTTPSKPTTVEIRNLTQATESNEIETVSSSSVKPPSTTTASIVTWTVNNEKNVSAPTTSSPPNSTSEEWVSLTTSDNWVPLPSVQASTTQGSSSTTAQASTTESASKPSITYIPLESTTSSVTLNASTVVTERVTSQSTPVGSTPPSTTVGSDTEIRPVNMSDFTDVCGRRMYPEGRIVGGEKSSFGKWPWQISLRQWRTSTYLHKCGAALLNENWAITAAHCVDNVPPSDLLLRLGEHDLSTESEPYLHQERRVQIVASHPQFDPRTFEYDLALLRFYEPVTFQPNILPVCVPQSDENFVGRTAYVTGWGRLYEDGPLPSILQEVSVPVINNSVCESMYRSAGYIEHIPHIFICAGWRRGGFDSCEGDSGGPMVIQRQDKRFLLAGVISWGIGCAEPNQPGVYTRISEFRDWINQILQF